MSLQLQQYHDWSALVAFFCNIKDCDHYRDCRHCSFVPGIFVYILGGNETDLTDKLTERKKKLAKLATLHGI
jgi:hypothetical protein